MKIVRKRTILAMGRGKKGEKIRPLQ